MNVLDIPRYVEANGILASGEGWCVGRAIGHDAAKLIVLVGNSDDPADVASVDVTALVRAHPQHTLLYPLDFEPAVTTVRPGARALLHTLAPDALPELDGAMPLPADAPLDHVPFAAELRRAPGTVWTAWVDGVPVSFAHASWRSRRWFDCAVDTLPGARQLGLGTIVAAAMIRDERALGREPVWGADVDNVASRRLAARLGFEDVDEIGVAPP